MMTSNMKVVTKKLKDLIPYENNPRINDEAVEYVKNSIKDFGFKVPIVIDKYNVVICGHTRLKASQELGLKEVPCVIADDLSDKQIQAFRLADNKTAEKSFWDKSKLNIELEDIKLSDIGMADYGFELFDEFEHELNALNTQKRVENILNLGKGQFKGTGKYDIPVLKPVKTLPKIKEWIGFNYVLSDDNPEGKAVHFFVDDYQFERIWNNPEAYVDKLSKYVCVATPDFSPYGDMPNALQIYNHYRKHWVGAFLQSRGIKVIPTIRCSTDKRSLEWYLDGEPCGGIVIISSMWKSKKGMDKAFKKEYNTMHTKLKPKKVFIYGDEVSGLPGNIEYIKTFTKARWEDD